MVGVVFGGGHILDGGAVGRWRYRGNACSPSTAIAIAIILQKLDEMVMSLSTKLTVDDVVAFVEPGKIGGCRVDFSVSSKSHFHTSHALMLTRKHVLWSNSRSPH